MSAIVYLNGHYLPIEQAHIPVLDRGFIFGDGIYEVIPVYGKKLFRLAQHLQRLNTNLDAIKIPRPLTDSQWQEILMHVIEQNTGIDQSVYLQVTRGVAPRDHHFPTEIKNTLFVMSTPLANISFPQGIKTITLEDIRWKYRHIKSTSLLANILLKQQAKDTGATEALLYTHFENDTQAYITEGAASNVFIVSQGNIITPPKSQHLLPGITRDLIVELAQQHQLPIYEQAISKEQLFQAEEVWISSSTKEIVPVVQIDQQLINQGQVGTITKKMLQHYREYKAYIRNIT